MNGGKAADLLPVHPVYPVHPSMTYSGQVHDPGTQPPPPPQTRGVFIRTGTGKAARAGITMGSTLAMVISWNTNESILWAIVHGFLSWLYVIYFAFTRGG